MEAKVTELVGDGSRVTGVRLGDGSLVPADLVVVGVGVVPDDGLARRAGLAVDDGITVDQHLVSSAPDVYAAGDVANAYHPVLGRQVRVEHWANARQQGEAAARSMLGQGTSYEAVPYFYSDQFDLGMEYTGYVGPAGYDSVVFRADPAGGEYVVFWLRAGRVLAGMNVNVWDVADAIAALVASGRTVDPARLADPAVPLDQVSQQAALRRR